MKSVFAYQDYRVFLQDYFDEMKSRKLLSWRIFAKQAGFSSPSYLKLVCQGKTNLSNAGINQVAVALDLKSVELDYFKILVNFNQAKNAEEKQKYLNQMGNLAQSKKVKVLNEIMYAFFSSWLNPVIREMVPRVSSTRPSEIARRFVSEVSAEEVKSTLQFLTKNNFLVKTPDGHYKQVERTLASQNRDITATVLRSFHRQMSELAVESLEKSSIDERHFSELFVDLSKEGYHKVLNEIIEFRRKIQDIATQDQELNRIYSLNMQLFPLTHKNTSSPKQKQLRSEKTKKNA